MAVVFFVSSDQQESGTAADSTFRLAFYFLDKVREKQKTAFGPETKANIEVKDGKWGR